MADSAAVDTALVATLAGDATLMSLMTDGVYMDIAPEKLTKFVVVDLASHRDDYVFEGSAFEWFGYRIRAVDRDTSGTRANSAAARIHTLLQEQALTIPGYRHCVTLREERLRYVEVDDVDAGIRWQHRGGIYGVVVAPL
jgi:hypothetical protein